MIMTKTTIKLDKGRAVEELLKPFLPLLESDDVTEISMNQPCEVWTKTLSNWTVHNIPELTANYMQGLITAIITYNGIGWQSIMYVILPGGQRGTIAVPPAVIDGTISFVIRKHSVVVKTLEQLHNENCFDGWVDVSFNNPNDDEINKFLNKRDFSRLHKFEGTLLRLKRDRKIKDFLEQCVQNKRNIVISGKTGSGKTTFARSLIEKVPTRERIITIEDVHELFLENHPNKVHMLYGNGSGRVSADECLTACMRESPDRIFLAELRGNEAWEYLNSLNNGHPGSITTVHANNALQTFERISTLIKKSDVGRQLDVQLIKSDLYTTIDVVLFFHDRKLIEVFYDPIFSKQQMN